MLNRAISSSPQREKSTNRRQPAAKGAPKSKLRHNDSQVEFTAVESSSPVAMESQLLTEHQREVRSRQQFEVAPLYPEFSSSPGPRRRASKSGLPLLDFSSQQGPTENGYATPTLNDDHGPMDEYITSSPTPKAAEKLQPAAAQKTEMDDSVAEAEDDNIPSSPPEMADEEMADETVYEGTTEIENLQSVEEQGITDARFETVPEDFSTVVPPEETKVDDSKALFEEAPTVEQAENLQVQVHPSIKRLAQNLEGGVSSDIYTDARSELNNEASTMNGPKDNNQVAGEESADQEAIHSDDSSPIPFTDSLSEQPQEQADNSAEPSAPKPTVTPGDISRVLDSFVGSTPDKDDTASAQKAIQTNPAKESIAALSASKRKREEPQEAQVSAKRRKSSASPFRRMVTRAFSFVTGSQVEKEDEDVDDEEDVQDCIVVGSQKDQEDESQSESADDFPIPELAPASIAPATAKRGRGRPRKSTTPVSAPVSAIRTRASKRRASTLEGEENEESVIIDTPAPTKTRRTTRSQDAKTDQPVEHVMLSPTHRRRGRELEAVLVSPRPSGGSSLVEESLVDDAVDDEQEEDSKDDDQEADSQLKLEAEKAIHEQPPTQSNWVVARLQELIINCKTMIIGPQEEREIRDALYELGNNVYEARRRFGD